MYNICKKVNANIKLKVHAPLGFLFLSHVIKQCRKANGNLIRNLCKCRYTYVCGQMSPEMKFVYIKGQVICISNWA